MGFGTRKSFEAACRHTQGAIIGTAYIKAIEGATDIGKATKEFLRFDLMKLVIIKYNAGNIQSVLYALERIGAAGDGHR